MNDTIYLKIGTIDRIPFDAFIQSLQNFKGVLEDLDATISENSAGSMVWEVVSLQKTSPAIVGVAPRLKRGHEDVSTFVENQLIENARLLASTGDRTKYLSDAALQKLQHLAARSHSLGPLTVFLNGDDPIRDQVEISEDTHRNVKELTSVKYSDFGSIYGDLDAISVHKGNEFRVWNEENNKSVKCQFDGSDLDKIKALLKERVVVTGIIQSNSLGLPISIRVEDVGTAPELDVPSVDEIIGLVPDITEGLSMSEYMKRLSDG